MFKYLIALLRAWLGIRADIAQKQNEHVGAVVQQNADLNVALKEAQKDEKVLSAPARAESDVDDDIMRHAKADK